MNLELAEEEVRVLRTTLEGCISDIREEIVKTEKHEWRAALHREEDILKSILGKLA